MTEEQTLWQSGMNSLSCKKLDDQLISLLSVVVFETLAGAGWRHYKKPLQKYSTVPLQETITLV